MVRSSLERLLRVTLTTTSTVRTPLDWRIVDSQRFEELPEETFRLLCIQVRDLLYS